MTSTNVFMGLADKNSSKVLKPPGGGHTDIFGAPEPPVRKNNGRNASSILEGTNVDKPTTPTSPTTPTKAAAPASVQEKTLPSPTQAAPPSRPRVPPGGHSSGPLW
ncbi:unnamed protein product [Ceutorhynchus assimilis]|uniref:Microtubule-associated protein Jupiter n=1 Tax=Ceutorhynchus assimilis TaxID=467358 RepID=A0A9N9QLW8_9CUCU|nr:unnamed protein product [Ceutorhynchus assimilis]